MMAAVAVTAIGLGVAVYAPGRWGAAVGGGIVGAGVACMHYLGMFAVEVPGRVTWSLDLVIVSITLGMLLGMAALEIAVRRHDVRAMLLAALLLTLAIVSHHFTAMGAVLIVPDPTRALKRAADHGLDFGLVCNPGTPFDAVAPFVEGCQVLLFMSVEPGFGGQALIPEVFGKIETAREWVEKRGLRADIQIDGGITPENSARAVNAGATVLVAGTAVFAADDPVAAIQQMRRAKETDD